MTIVGVLLALFVAGAGFERFDALQGGGLVGITPAVLLSPVLVAVRLGFALRPRAAAAHETAADVRRRVVGAGLITAFVGVAAASVIVATVQDVAPRRFVLLGLIVSGACAAVSIARLTGDVRALQVGAWLGLGLTAAIDLAQVQTWLTVGPALPARIGPVDVTSPTYGLFAPRPSGLSPDPNRGAFIAALFYYLLTVDPWTRVRGMRTRWFVLTTALTGAVVLASFSRTGIVVLLVVLVVALRRHFGARRGIAVAAAFGALLLVAGGAVIAALQSTGAVAIDQLLQERANLSSGESGGIHLELFGIAYRVLALDPVALAGGIGFGNSPTVLQGVFVGQQGNFHSLYLTALVEVGVVGLVLALALLLGPLRSPRVVLAAVTAAFNLLYQADLDASFWLVVALLWLAPGAPAAESPGPVALTAAARRTPALSSR